MTTCVYDLETLPAISIDPALWHCKIPPPPVPGKVPSNYKSDGAIAKAQAGIAAKYADAIEAWDVACAEARTEAYRDGSLHPLQARVLCAGLAFDDDDPHTIYANYDQADPSDYDDVEEGLIIDFARDVRNARPNKFIGHRLAFDLTMVMMRAQKYGVTSLLSDLPWVRKDKWNGRIFCTYEHSQEQMRWKGASLDAIAKYYGIPGKPDGIDGSKVYDYWLENRHDEIRRYCEHDVSMTREVARKMGVLI